MDLNLRKSWGSFIRSHNFYLILAILVIGIIATYINPRFAQTNNLLAVLQQVSVLGITTMAMAMLLTSGGIDLSIAGIMGLTIVVATKLAGTDVGLFFAITAALVVATLCGFINGYIIAKTKAMPLIITLGMMGVYLGIAFIISDGKFLSFKGEFKFLGQGKVLGLPMPVIAFSLVVLFCYILRKHTHYGRRLNAIGGNEQTAYLSGINVQWHTISIYAFAGFLFGLAALVLASRVGVVLAGAGEGYELRALAAAIIGGVTFEGGRGTIIGATLGVLLMGIVINAMNILGLNSYAQSIFLGGIIVATTVASQMKNRT